MKTRAASVAIVLLCAVGCGQKGPLYLPDHAGAVVTRPAAGAQDTGATAPIQQPAATREPAATQQPAATSGTGPAPAGVPKKSSGKDADSSQK